MGIPERREREREKRRSDIIDAAERVFFFQGVGSATMDDVAEAAELSKGTLYLYFESKEDLYFAIIGRGIRILQAAFEAAVAAAATGLEKVQAVGRAYFDFCREYPDYFNAMLYFESSVSADGDISEHARACIQQSDETFGICARAVRAGVEDGTIRDDVDPETIALTLYGLSTGLLQIIAVKDRLIRESHAIEPEQLVESFFDLVYRALRSEAPAG